MVLLENAATQASQPSVPCASPRWCSPGHISVQPEGKPFPDRHVEAVGGAASWEQGGEFSVYPSLCVPHVGLVAQ